MCHSAPMSLYSALSISGSHLSTKNSQKIPHSLPIRVRCRESFESSKCEQVQNDIIQWKHFPRYWPFMRGIHRSPVDSPHKSYWRRVLMFSLICAWANSWANNRDTSDSRCNWAHYDDTVMFVRFLSLYCARYLFIFYCDISRVYSYMYMKNILQGPTLCAKTVQVFPPPELDLSPPNKSCHPGGH